MRSPDWKIVDEAHGTGELPAGAMIRLQALMTGNAGSMRSMSPGSLVTIA